MTPERFGQLMQAFDALAPLAPQQRAAALGQWPQLDEEALQQLQRLLAADSTGLLHTARRIDAALVAQWQDLQPGARIGPYEIEAKIGSGGMGEIFRARRCDGEIDQRVAIKLMRPERLDAAVLARFRLERQMLALLRHPHIAAMLDIGELEPGRPYIAMEFVDGEAIDAHVRAHRPGLPQRLALFLQVCSAVQHAHDNLIVHRDLKPGNVLVDRDGQARLLDFGIAKPLTARLGVFAVEQTGTAQRFFSLHNVAPEQLRGDPATPACDIYGLGVLLYELLAGAPPFDFGDCTAAQAEAMVLEQEPPAPSRRAAAAAAQQAALPARVIQGDLDAIVLRCLRKTPSDRYRRVGDLVADIEAFLSEQPVKARAGNLGYRAGRFLRRNRRRLAGALLLGAGLGAGTYAYLAQHRETQGQRARAERVTALILDALKSVDPSEARSRDISAREVFERVAAQAASASELDADVRDELLLTVATIDNRIGAYRQALDLLERMSTGGDHPWRSELAALQRAGSLSALGRLAEAQALVERQLPQSSSSDLRTQWLLVQAEIALAQGRREDALRVLDTIDRRGLSVQRLDQVRLSTGEMLDAAGYYDRAETEFATLLADQRQRLPAVHPALLLTLQGSADLAWHMDRVAQAEAFAAQAAPIAEALYGRRSMSYLAAKSYTYRALEENGNYAAAALGMQEMLDISAEVRGVENPRTIGLRLNLAELYNRSGEAALADTNYRQLIEAAERVMRPDDLRRLIFRVAYGEFLLRQQRYADARTTVAPALAAAVKYPALQVYSVVPILKLVDALAVHAQAPTPPHAARVREHLAASRNAADSISARQSVEGLTLLARKLGIE